mmetsp:Transcript_1613/g.5560  ORF Transcript_1613/g.5560 Transcript_1613/m.5560 type:complete len:1347 (-) Transcript_1613:213-4253(-)|eukprot:CAMPEP_0117450288 /NCGR_PEP_ID=MMETSP0759-20121206/8388_1 /TAXON_ID=63605 /ORGANISM="Percolomonas cosmopolitus, Strain WS" /LENGTH=1346 /DNA_ID=CAMNT_0005242799 /DNA_START=228 /DNA_END=4268 /DNA_ORIENTATION=+
MSLSPSSPSSSTSHSFPAPSAAPAPAPQQSKTLLSSSSSSASLPTHLNTSNTSSSLFDDIAENTPLELGPFQFGFGEDGAVAKGGEMMEATSGAGAGATSGAEKDGSSVMGQDLSKQGAAETAIGPFSSSGFSVTSAAPFPQKASALSNTASSPSSIATNPASSSPFRFQIQEREEDMGGFVFGTTAKDGEQKEKEGPEGNEEVGATEMEDTTTPAFGTSAQSSEPSPFSFGGATLDEEQSTGNLFSFGDGTAQKDESDKKNSTSSGFTFGEASGTEESGGFSFGGAQETSKTSPKKSQPFGGFSFGESELEQIENEPQQTEEQQDSSSDVQLAIGATSSEPTTGFTFGGTITEETGADKEASSTGGFGGGTETSTTQDQEKTTSGFSFTSVPSKELQAGFTFGEGSTNKQQDSTSSKFSFGDSFGDTPKGAEAAAAEESSSFGGGFTFPSSEEKQPSFDTGKGDTSESAFSFGNSEVTRATSQKPQGFSFDTSDSVSKGFNFGTSSETLPSEPAKESTATQFSFGALSGQEKGSTGGFTFGDFASSKSTTQSTEPASESASSFGGGFSFGAQPKPAATTEKTAEPQKESSSQLSAEKPAGDEFSFGVSSQPTARESSSAVSTSGAVTSATTDGGFSAFSGFGTFSQKVDDAASLLPPRESVGEEDWDTRALSAQAASEFSAFGAAATQKPAQKSPERLPQKQHYQDVEEEQQEAIMIDEESSEHDIESVDYEFPKRDYALIRDFHDAFMILHYSLSSIGANNEYQTKNYRDGEYYLLNKKQQLLSVAAAGYARHLDVRVQLEEKDESAQLLNDQKCLLLLVQAMHLSSQFSVVALLSNWVRCFNPPSAEDMEDEGNVNWTIIYELALQDDMPAVAERLDSHLNALMEEEPTSLYARVKDLIVSKPRIGPRSSFSDYKMQFKRWQLECSKLMPSLDNDLKELFNIFTGNIRNIDAHSRKWFDSLIGTLLYTCPTCSRAEVVSMVMDKYRERLSMDDEDDAQIPDYLIYSLIDTENIAGAIKNICIGYGHFFAFHLVDLLWYANVIDDTIVFAERDVKNQFQGLNVRERMLKEFLHTLENGEGADSAEYFWKIALDYASTSMHTKEEEMERIVQGITPNTERQVQQLATYCENFPFLQNAAREARIKLAHRYIDENKQFASGVYHLLRAGNEKACVDVIDALLDQLLRGASQDADRMLDDDRNVDVHQALKEIAEVVQSRFSFDGSVHSERLVFVAQYFKMLELLEAQKFKNAANLITLLMSSDSRLRVPPAPRKFWIILFSHALPLLENDERVIFNTEQTDTLMNCLEELCISHRRREYLGNISEDQLNLIRLALTRNLSRAILED